MKVLHLSDTPLSGSPIRINNLLNKHTLVQSKHLVWAPKVQVWRKYDTDLVSSEMTKDEVVHWLNWADIVHYHNRWRRQMIFQKWGLSPPEKPSVIQMHSPRHGNENFTDEATSKIPIAVIAQYHVRQWPECSFIVPNVVDTTEVIPDFKKPKTTIPVVSYAPSNCTAKGWDSKGYEYTAPVLKRLSLIHKIKYQLIVQKPFEEVIPLKRMADIGIDEFVTGSYHLSSLEYFALNVPCYAYLDSKTQDVVKRLTGATHLPWLQTSPQTFRQDLLRDIKHIQKIPSPRKWMSTYWNPEILSNHYVRMYERIQ